HRDDAVGDRRGAGHIRDGPGVARRRHDDDAVVGRVLGGDRRGVVGVAVVGAEAHVDNVDGVVDGAVAAGVERPLDGVGHEIGGAGDVAEHLQGVELGVGRHPGRGLVGAEAGGRGRHVGAVAVDVEGVVVGLRGVEVRVGGVVVGAGEVVAVDHFVVGEAVAVHELVGVVGGVVVGLAASAHGQMRVVDARVDDGDRGPFAGQAQGVVFGGSGAGADPGDAGLVQQVVAGDGRHRL